VDVYFTHLHTQSTTYIDSQYSCVSLSCVNVLYKNSTDDDDDDDDDDNSSIDYYHCQ